MVSSPPDLELARRLSRADSLVVVATTRPDGTLHASVVNAGVLDDPVTGNPVVGLVAGGSARKLEHMRRSGRAAVVFRSGWQWVAVEGPVRIIGPEEPDEPDGPDEPDEPAEPDGPDGPHEPDGPDGFDRSRLPALLRDIFTAAGGTHEDWDEFDRVMAAERRTAVLIEPARVTTN